MEADVDLIVEVQPEEAEKLIWLVAFLLEDWYVNREQRKQQLKQIGALPTQKAEEKKQARHKGSEQVD